MSHFDEENEDASGESGMRTIAKCQCGGCGRYFSGNTVFEKHRIGAFQEPIYAGGAKKRAKESPIGYTKANRRCMTDEELRASGVEPERLLVRLYHDGHPQKEEHDVWCDVGRREMLRQAFARTGADDCTPPLEAPDLNKTADDIDRQ